VLEAGTRPADDVAQWPVATPPSTSATISSDGSGLDGSFDDIGGAPVTALAEEPTSEDAERGVDVVDVREIPVDDWAELSFADAQGRLHDVDEQGLRALIAYETEHGNRLHYTLLLEQRLAALEKATDA
jgi:hypothetical protein